MADVEPGPELRDVLVRFASALMAAQQMELALSLYVFNANPKHGPETPDEQLEAEWKEVRKTVLSGLINRVHGIFPIPKDARVTFDGIRDIRNYLAHHFFLDQRNLSKFATRSERAQAH